MQPWMGFELLNGFAWSEASVEKSHGLLRWIGNGFGGEERPEFFELAFEETVEMRVLS